MSDIPVGSCQCGCGQKTKAATRNHLHCGYAIGEPLRFIMGHRSRLPRRRRPMPEMPPQLCGCGCGQPTKLITESWAAQGHVRGAYRRFIKGHDKRKTPHEYVVEDRGYETPCWIWTRGKSSSGYGVATGGARKNKGAHRDYYEREHGAIPDGHFLDHKCRQHDCVHPNHTEAVPPRINSRRSTNSRLTEETVLAILASSETNAQLGRQYAVSESTIRDIRTGRTWRDLSSPTGDAWCVYALCEPETGGIRYIGKTNNAAHRLRGHCKPAHTDRSARAVWIRALRVRGVRPSLIILESCSGDRAARAAERSWITTYRNDGCNLLNGRHKTTPAPVEHGPSWRDDHRFRLHPELQARGEHVKTAKLTEAQVREMRQRYDAGSAGTPTLGRLFGVSTTMAQNIVKRLSWKHVG